MTWDGFFDKHFKLRPKRSGGTNQVKNARENSADRGTAARYSEAGEDLQTLRAERRLLWRGPGKQAGVPHNRDCETTLMFLLIASPDPIS